MKTRSSSPATLVLAGALVAALSACAPVGPDYRRPDIDLPAAFPGAPSAEDAGRFIPAQWWMLYGDPILDDLVVTTLRRNVDLRRAAAQIEEAEATLSEAAASIFPEVDLSGSSTRSRSSTFNRSN